MAAKLTGLLDTFTVAMVDDAVMRKAASWDWSDFEDAVQMAAAMLAGADHVITRNPRDFQGGHVLIVQPGAFLALLAPGPGLSNG